LGVVALVLVVFAGVMFFSQIGNVTYAAAPTPEPVTQTAAVETPTAFATVEIEATSSIVVDLATGRVLYEHNPDVQLPLASLTKVTMAYVVAESMPTDTIITIPHDTAPTGNAERLSAGSRWHLPDLMTFTLVASSNDGAEILASAANPFVHTRYPQSPADTATLWRMNDFVHSLGLTNTYFLNPSGLDESTTQAGAYGSARDMAKLFAFVASTSPEIYSGTTHDGFHLMSLDGQTATVTNTDEALSAIPGITMGKTGYTDLAGGNLAVVFNFVPGHPVVAVVMHSTRDGRFADMKKLVAATREALLTSASAQ
jgi:D-alanyl-D-alanine carboxypeptidase